MYHDAILRPMNTYVILHNIRSAHNVGSIFRTADGAGVSKIFLTGYTPTPIDRFGRENSEIKKTSLGASKIVPYNAESDVTKVLSEMKRHGVQIVAVEQTVNAISYQGYKVEGDTVFIFGNEVTGIEEDVLAQADTHIQVPMSGIKESLNVSVCAGIILFAFKDKNNHTQKCID